jgi:uncharacterized membrane protein HdeD (DUF308 family)
LFAAGCFIGTVIGVNLIFKGAALFYFARAFQAAAASKETALLE